MMTPTPFNSASSPPSLAGGAPAIPSGELVGDRYRILRVLGQGGFGRTYLAKDIQRFDETCVLKEFAPQNQSASGFDGDKARRLFEREAGVLYRLNHPQIPKFRELSQQHLGSWNYLFLVQDYIEGRTYQDWRLERQQQGLTLGETDVLYLLRHLLPVLDYLHRRGVIHRDISPDNLIQRQCDGLPVLIDFGAVKQAVVTLLTQLRDPSSDSPSQGPPPSSVASSPNPETDHLPGTCLGKLGYAPPEQMHQGKAFAHSDLYALGATALTLLSGLEPQMLMDPHTLEWTWQESLSLQPGLAQFLAKLVALRPADRYASAAIALKALDQLVPPQGSESDSDFTIAFSSPPLAGAAMAQTMQVNGTGAAIGGTAETATTQAIRQKTAGSMKRHWNWGFLPLLAGLGLWAGLSYGLGLPPFQGTRVRLNWPWLQPSSSGQGAFSKATDPGAEVSLEVRLQTERDRLKIPADFFEQLVTEQFIQEHPSLQNAPPQSSPSPDQTIAPKIIMDPILRAEWQGMARVWLKQLEALPLALRSRLGQFQAADLQTWSDQVEQRGESAAGFLATVDQRFSDRFAGQKRPKPHSALEQLWFALAQQRAEEIVTGQGKALKKPPSQNASAAPATATQFSPPHPPLLTTLIIDDAGNGYHQSQLRPGQSQRINVSLRQGQRLRVSLESRQRQQLTLAIQAPGPGFPLLPARSQTYWEGILPATGSYQLVITSKASGSLDYTLNLIVEEN